jgi:prevent-host-death family protein
MVRRVSSAEAELHLAAPMDEVAAGDTEIIIEQQGRPLAALVSIKRLAGSTGRCDSPHAR